MKTAAPIPAEVIADWRRRHDEKGSTPEYIKATEGFASIETALLFDWSLRRSTSHQLHPEARKFAMCLSSCLKGRDSQVEASEADVKRWGVDGRALSKAVFAGMYSHPWALLTEALLAEDMLIDKRKRSSHSHKRILHLRLTPVRTDVRGKIPLERPTEILKDLRIPTVTVPSRYFRSDVVASLPPKDFFGWVAIHSLTDMQAWGGCDPYHLRVEGGHLVMSPELSEVLGVGAAELLDSLIALAEAGLIIIVPAELRVTKLPSSASSYEWLSDSLESESFVVRPTAIYRKGGEPRQANKREFPDEAPPSITVSNVATRPGVLAVELADVYQVPQYDWGPKVVSDRIAASMKSQIRKAAPHLGLTSADVAVAFHPGETGLSVSLVHVGKLCIDALVRAGTLRDDSRFVMRGLTLLHGDEDMESRPYIHVEIAQPDGGKRFTRRYYLVPYGWRPPSRRATSPLSGWNTYSDYIASIDTAVGELPSLGLSSEALRASSLKVEVSAPTDERFDLDNVGLFVCDLLTAAAARDGITEPVDALVREVVLTEQPGPRGMRIVLESLS